MGCFVFPQHFSLSVRPDLRAPWLTDWPPPCGAPLVTWDAVRPVAPCPPRHIVGRALIRQCWPGSRLISIACGRGSPRQSPAGRLITATNHYLSFFIQSPAPINTQPRLFQDHLHLVHQLFPLSSSVWTLSLTLPPICITLWSLASQIWCESLRTLSFY